MDLLLRSPYVIDLCCALCLACFFSYFFPLSGCRRFLNVISRFTFVFICSVPEKQVQLTIIVLPVIELICLIPSHLVQNAQIGVVSFPALKVRC